MQENMTRSGTPEGMRENYKKATVEMLILHLLSESPMYVYQLIQSFESRSKGLYKVATLYSVALETVRALESQMIMRNYKGFLD